MGRYRGKSVEGKVDIESTGLGGAKLLSSPLAAIVSEFDVHARTLKAVETPLTMLMRLAVRNDGSEADEALILTLWTGLLVQYARCFDPTNKKHRLDEKKCFAGYDTLSRSHENVMEIRSKHLAHDVNGFRFCDIGVQVLPDGSMGELIRAFFHALPSGDDLVNLEKLASHAGKFAVAERDEAKRLLILELHRLTAEERMALPNMTYDNLHRTPIKRPRRAQPAAK